MNRDDILLALRFVAMGRVNHPQVEQLAEKLGKLMNPELGVVGVLMTDDGEKLLTAPKDVAVAINAVADAAFASKRRKKAD